ncbi:uncharacterized protein [Watersipora subatra]|uniref:uncharacterized protein isoform X2 n=1 Tax=Watersipora subatra TaxID=2589382 RepID=UPI00355C8D56
MRRFLKQYSLLVTLITATLSDSTRQYSRGVKVGSLPANLSSTPGLAAGQENSDLLYILSGSQVLVLEKNSAELVSTVSVLESDNSNWSWDAIAVGKCGETQKGECIYLAKQVDNNDLRLIQFKVDRKLDKEHEMTLAGSDDLTIELSAPTTRGMNGLLLLVDPNADISLLLQDGEEYYSYQISHDLWSSNQRTVLNGESRERISLGQGMKLKSLYWTEDESFALQVNGKPNEIFVYSGQRKGNSLVNALKSKGHHIKLRPPKGHMIKSLCFSAGSIYSVVEDDQHQLSLFLHEPMKYTSYQSDQSQAQKDSSYVTCEDKNKHCSTWAQNDMCLKRKSYMTEYCPVSCNSCRERERMMNHPKCADSNHLCAVWAKQGNCRSGSSQGYMLQNCKKSCKVCSEFSSALAMCRDEHEYCYGWAQSDRCKSRSDYMNKYCKASCGLCPVASDGKSLQSDQASSAADRGCKDMSEYCDSWAKEGKCESRKDYMFLNCPASCSLCGKVTEQDNSAAVCEDSSEYCLIWETYGYCKAKTKYMMKKCPATCQLCRKAPRDRSTDKCVDVYESCGAYAEHGMCTLKPVYMKENCPRSCGKCQTEEISNKIFDETSQPTSWETTTPTPITTLDYCIDKDRRCPEWRDAGYCTRRPDYMTVYCQESCDLCETEKQTTPDTPDKLQSTTQSTATLKSDNKIEEQKLTPTCVDTNSRCSFLVSRGYCNLRPDYMSVYCNESCGYCSASGKHGQLFAPTTTLATQTTTKNQSCQDFKGYCEVWASAGLCNTRAEVMRDICPASCNICDQDSRTTPAPTTTNTEAIKMSCSDRSSLCSQWQAAGYCTSRELYMRQTCSKSCGFCGEQSAEVKCEDKNQFCVAWGQKNRCQQYRSYMERNCPKTCNFCESRSSKSEDGGFNECRDENKYCSRWAEKAYCSIRVDYMRVKCRKSCSFC